VCFGQPVFVLARFKEQGAVILRFFKGLTVAIGNYVFILWHVSVAHIENNTKLIKHHV
jgi:hypothetical protein